MIPHNKGVAGPYKEPKRNMLAIMYHLRKARYSLGISINRLSEISGYSNKTIRGWEEGTSAPGVKAISDWANALGFDIVLRDRSTGHILTALDGSVKVRRSTIGDDNDSSRYGKVG